METGRLICRVKGNTLIDCKSKKEVFIVDTLFDGDEIDRIFGSMPEFDDSLTTCDYAIVEGAIHKSDEGYFFVACSWFYLLTAVEGVLSDLL